jgi:hypothetical protein
MVGMAAESIMQAVARTNIRRALPQSPPAIAPTTTGVPKHNKSWADPRWHLPKGLPQPPKPNPQCAHNHRSHFESAGCLSESLEIGKGLILLLT